MYYDIFTTEVKKWDYLLTLPPIFDNNAFGEYRIAKIKKWNWNMEYEIIRQFDWDIIKLLDTQKRKLKVRLYVIKTQ